MQKDIISLLKLKPKDINSRAFCRRSPGATLLETLSPGADGNSVPCAGMARGLRPSLPGGGVRGDRHQPAGQYRGSQGPDPAERPGKNSRRRAAAGAESGRLIHFYPGPLAPTALPDAMSI
jgi:hypothetical protein